MSVVNLSVQSEYRKIRTRQNSVFGHFSRSACCAPALRHYSFCKTLHLKSLIVFWIRLCSLSPYSGLMLCTPSDTFRILAHSELCLFRYVQAYSSIFTHTEALLRRAQSYSGIFSILCNPRITKPWHISNRRHIQNPVKPDQAYSELCHSQNSLFRHYSPIFRNIENLV